MVLTLPSLDEKRLFRQTDVRETPVAAAQAPTTATYLTVTANTDLTNERTLTAGVGIDFTDLGANSTFTIDGENASDTNKGVASFDLTDFSVTSGAVALKSVVCMSIDGDSGTATPSVHNIDIIGGDGITTLGASNDITITNSDHSAVVTNTSKVTNATHTGDVTGATELTIGADKVHDSMIDWGTGVSQVSAVDLVIADAGVIITATEVEGALQENRTAIDLNTAKDTNVTTNLSAGTRAPTTIDVNSSDGTNATLVEADTTNAGILGSDKWDEIVANTTHRGLTNEHLDWTADLGATNVNAANYTDTGDTTYTAGEGIDIASEVISGEDATTSNKGIASFNTDDFTVSSGAVSLKNKTSYASICSSAFQGATPDVDDVTHQISGLLLNAGGTVAFNGCIQIPHGAVVTGAKANGTNTGQTWSLIRTTLNGHAESVMAGASIDTEDTTITNGTIDNSLYSYNFRILMDNTDKIEGARVTYTTNYI